MPWFWTDDLAQTFHSGDVDQGLIDLLTRNPVAIRVEAADSDTETASSDGEVPLAA